MKKIKFVQKDEFAVAIRRMLDFLFDKDWTQTKIGNYLDVTDRTVRKWYALECIPNGADFYNLLLLCNELKHEAKEA